MSDQPSVRINKYLTEAGFCSRREADRLIDAGRVTINGKVPELGTKINAGDEVRVDGKRISPFFMSIWDIGKIIGLYGRVQYSPTIGQLAQRN
jgi:ribosomal 50S subunit-recycling heat shock protein